jgi:SNF2 family DNA or RNA helicase
LVWEQECRQWEHTKDFKVVKMTGTAKQRQKALFSDAQIYLCNYESLDWLSMQLDHYFIHQGRPLPFSAIIYDEISKMKTPSSKRFKRWMRISKSFDIRIGMTADASTNGIKDLWSQFYLIDGGKRLGDNYKEFMNIYFSQNLRRLKTGRSFIEYKELNYSRDLITKAVKDITLVIKVEDHLEMPKLNFIKRYCELPKKDLKRYNNLKKELAFNLSSGKEVLVKSATSLTSKLLQFSNGQVYNYSVDGDIETRETEFIHEKKYDELIEVMEGLKEECVIITYLFNFDRVRIQELFPQAECLTGTNDHEAEDIINRFQTGKLKILLLHPASGGHGLNLQHSCHVMIWFGLTYDLDLWQQCIGRINRQGQTLPVLIFVLMSVGTIEDKVLGILQEKGNVSKEIKRLVSS